MITQNVVCTETLPTTINDHFTVLLHFTNEHSSDRKTVSNPTMTRNTKSLKGHNALNFLFLLDQKLKQINEKTSAEFHMESIVNSVSECVDKFAPLRVSSVKEPSNQWINNKIKNAVTKRNKLFQTWVENPTKSNHDDYKSFRNKVCSMIREAKKQDNFKKLGVNPTARAIYRTLKTQKTNDRQPNELPDLEKLNEFFVNIGSILSSRLPQTAYNSGSFNCDKTLFMEPTGEFEVASIIKALKNKKSCGIEGISNEILKCCSPIIERHLALAFNKCIDEGVFPNIFKTAKVVPLFKKGDKKDPANYRPISLLSSLSKVFEKILHNRMIRFTEKNNLICPMQYGFRNSMSCVDAIAAITEFVRTEIDKKAQGQACFIDLQKAFDTLDHDILLKKLVDYGFRGKIFDILKNYLSERWQYISHNGVCTKKLKIVSGVPQGSVLGPFLFLLYINDIHLCMGNCTMAMFADDTTICSSKRKGVCSIQSDIDNVSQWFCQNRLSINRDKCEAVAFGRGHPNEILILDKKLPYSNACKYLGVYVDKTLRFREHIDYVEKKLNKFCGLIYRVRHMFNKKCLLMFYNSFAKSKICYGLLIYGSAAKTNLLKIEKAQRRILRAIFFKKIFDSLRDLFRTNKILTVFELFILENIKELFRQLRLEAPKSFIVLDANDVRTYTTRWNMKKLIPAQYNRTVLKRRSLENFLRLTYNWLMEAELIPKDVRKLSSYQVKKLITSITTNYVVDSKYLFAYYFEKELC